MANKGRYCYACADRAGSPLGYVWAETIEKARVLGLEKYPETFGSCARFNGVF